MTPVFAAFRLLGCKATRYYFSSLRSSGGGGTICPRNLSS